MKREQIYTCFLLLCVFVLKAQDINFNNSWKFVHHDIDFLANPINPSDRQWTWVDLPHDYAIQPFLKAKTKKRSLEQISKKSCYFKSFTLNPTQKGKIVRIEFEGVMQRCSVWVNGQNLVQHHNGNLGFEVDITDVVKYDGSENIIVLKVESDIVVEGIYVGAGIYRSVWLRVDEPIYIDTWGTYFKTTSLSDKSAVVENETRIINRTPIVQNMVLNERYIAPGGVVVAEHKQNLVLAANSNEVYQSFVKIPYPKKWSVDKPNLYSVISTLESRDQRVDAFLTHIGLRKIGTSSKGWTVNEAPLYFQGVCLTESNGLLGIANYRATHERKLKLIKKMGANAVRTIGVPPSREFLEICDELGLYVIDEAFSSWKEIHSENKDSLLLSDLKKLVIRDRNHPSVVMWNLGDRILEPYLYKDAFKLAKRLKQQVLKYDFERPMSLSFSKNTQAFDLNLAQQVDYVGLDFSVAQFEHWETSYPYVNFYGSRESGFESQRGVYPEIGSSQDSLASSSFSYPPDVVLHYQGLTPDLKGGFIWSGFDVLEGNMYHPDYTKHFGVADVCGFPKDLFYFYQTHWSKTPSIYLSPHWNWKGKEGDVVPVTCFTNCEQVELFLNGKSLGKKSIENDGTKLKVHKEIQTRKVFHSRYRFMWNVPYQQGRLKAIGYEKGIKVKEHYIDTAGKPHHIQLAQGKSTTILKDELTYVEVKIVDKNGNVCTQSNHELSFKLNANAKIITLENGKLNKGDLFDLSKIKVHKGLCLLAIKAIGNKKEEIELTVKGSGLPKAKLKWMIK